MKNKDWCNCTRFKINLRIILRQTIKVSELEGAEFTATFQIFQEKKISMKLFLPLWFTFNSN